jgi:hypothetical protein
MKLLLFVLLGTAVAAAMLGCGSPENIEVGLEVPLEVGRGQEFNIIASITNTASDTQKLVSIDIGDSYLKGIAILKTEPDHKEAVHIPIANMMSYDFDLPIKPGEKIMIVMHAKALKFGDYNADIDFCINSDSSFLTKSLRTIVE